MSNIYVLSVDMEDRNVEDIARDAVTQIVELFDRLVEDKAQTQSED